MIKHNYKLIINDDGYIESGYVSDNDFNFTGQLADYPDITEGWCKLVDGIIVIDENKKADIIEERNKEAEIKILKEKLTDTDYIITKMSEDLLSLDNPLTFVADFIKVLTKFSSDYASTISDRKAWRDRIEELSK